MGGLLAFAQRISDFIVGPFGISAITIAIAVAAIHAAISDRGDWGRVGRAVVAGAFVFGAGWVVNTFLV